MSAEQVKIKLTENIETVPIRVLGRSHLACVRCRTQKTKCDGEKPTCKTCSLSNKECYYEFKDRKIILFESQLNKLQNRIKYLEANLKDLTLKSDNIKIIDSSFERQQQQNDQSQHMGGLHQEPFSIIKKEEDLDDDGDDATVIRNLSPTGFLNQQYPSFVNPLFGNPENFNQDYFNPTHSQRTRFDKIVINPTPTTFAQSLESINKNVLEFDYALQNCLGEFAYLDSLNPIVSNFHPNSKHFLSDNYFIYPYNGYITLPEKEYTLELFHIVYQRLGSFSYIVDKRDFLSKVDEIYENLNSQTASFVCRLLLVLAIGEQLVFSKLSFDPDFIAKYGERTNTGIAGLKFFTLAIQLFRYNHENYTISNIQTCILLAYYEQILNRTTSAFSFYGLAVKLSLAIGLHRKDPRDESDPIKKEQKKRLWWSAFTLSSKCSAKMHFPLEVDYFDTDVDLPAENAIDLGDGFNVELLDAEVKICRYFNDICKTIYGVNTRNFRYSYELKDPAISLREKLDKILFILDEFDGVKKSCNSIFQKIHLQVTSMAKARTRDEANIVLSYHCSTIFVSRPVVLSYFRGLLKDTDEIRKIATCAIDSACEIIKILHYLCNTNLLQTFDYWDNQHCFSALLILTVAGLAGVKSPLSTVGVEIMAFMANCGNHSARAYFEKLITLDECLTSSGRSSVYDKPLTSLISYTRIDKTKGVGEDQHKILVKTQELAIDEFKVAPRKISKKSSINKKQTFQAQPNEVSSTILGDQQHSSKQQFEPIFSDSQNYRLTQQQQQQQQQSQQSQSQSHTKTQKKQSAKQQQKQSAKQQQKQAQLTSQHTALQEKLSEPRSNSPSSQGFRLTSSLPNPAFNNDPDFFNELVSSIQVWENPFSQNFINNQQQGNSDFNTNASISEPGNLSDYQTRNQPSFPSHSPQQHQHQPQLSPSQLPPPPLVTLRHQQSAPTLGSSQFIPPTTSEDDIFETGNPHIPAAHVPVTNLALLSESQQPMPNLSINPFQNYTSK